MKKERNDIVFEYGKNFDKRQKITLTICFSYMIGLMK